MSHEWGVIELGLSDSYLVLIPLKENRKTKKINRGTFPFLPSESFVVLLVPFSQSP